MEIDDAAKENQRLFPSTFIQELLAHEHKLHLLRGCDFVTRSDILFGGAGDKGLNTFTTSEFFGSSQVKTLKRH